MILINERREKRTNTEGQNKQPVSIPASSASAKKTVLFGGASMTGGKPSTEFTDRVRRSAAKSVNKIHGPLQSCK
jgi:hypothetical protein